MHNLKQLVKLSGYMVTIQQAQKTTDWRKDNQGQPTKDLEFIGVRSTREMMLNKNYSHGPA
jgi:hypothetical protein